MRYPGDDEPLSGYEAPFRARITEGEEVDGRWRHGFVEVGLSPATGDYVTTESARYGTPTAGWLALPSGEQIAADTVVWAAFAGMISGVPVYDAVLGSGGAVTGFKRGKLDGAMSFGGSATMSVWEWNGTANVDSGENVTVYDWLLSTGQTIAAGKQVTASYDAASGRWIVTGGQCP